MTGYLTCNMITTTKSFRIDRKFPSEFQEGIAEGVAVAGPLRVVELDHLPLLPVLPEPWKIFDLDFERNYFIAFSI